MGEFSGYPVKRGFRDEGWELDDVVGISNEHPNTFEVPRVGYARVRMRQ